MDYSAVVISDHAPLFLDLSFTLLNNARPPWKLNPILLLKDDTFCDMIPRVITDFLSTNNSNDMSPSLLWETLKVVIRGEIISFCSRRRKLRKQKQEQLIEDISKLDEEHSTSQSSELYKIPHSSLQTNLT